MSIFEALLQHDHVPNFYRVENTRSAPKLEDVAAETRRVMQESGTLEQLKPGQSVCIAAGSREIANIALIVRTVCEVVREHGAEPFIIPAMGSHAGAQAEGQKKILADFGITEEYTGAPIRSSMETVQVGVTKPHGFPARIDRYAAEADWIIPIGRIKPHTDIRGPIQSGILKMIVIGMGKQFGADICHAEGFPSMSQNIVEIGLEIIANTNILCGMASMENGYHETYRVVAVAPDKILETEKELLPDAAAQLFIGKRVSAVHCLLSLQKMIPYFIMCTSRIQGRIIKSSGNTRAFLRKGSEYVIIILSLKSDRKVLHIRQAVGSHFRKEVRTCLLL